MTAVRCPNCGRDNPLEAEVCRFCQAELKPASVPPFSGEGAPIDACVAPRPNNTGELELDLPDWLRDLRGNEIEPETEPEFEGGLPDWLQASETRGEEEAPVNETGSPDWLGVSVSAMRPSRKGSESTQDKDLEVGGSQLKRAGKPAGRRSSGCRSPTCPGNSGAGYLARLVDGLGRSRGGEDTSAGNPRGTACAASTLARNAAR